MGFFEKLNTLASWRLSCQVQFPALLSTLSSQLCEDYKIFPSTENGSFFKKYIFLKYIIYKKYI